MLMITPRSMLLLDMQSETRRRINVALSASGRYRAVEVTLPTRAQKRRQRYADQVYRRKLIDQTAAILRQGEPTSFAFEGFMRHGLRSGLCLRGWSWPAADEMASDIVRSALAQIGAKRPTYQQGQPEWVQYGVVLVERERCVQCGAKLPVGHRKFCSSRCARAHNDTLHRRFTAEQLGAVYGPA